MNFQILTTACVEQITGLFTPPLVRRWTTPAGEEISVDNISYYPHMHCGCLSQTILSVFYQHPQVNSIVDILIQTNICPKF